MKIATFEIYFEDLTDVAQHYLCNKLKTTIEKEKQDSLPLAVVLRERKEKKEEEEN